MPSTTARAALCREFGQPLVIEEIQVDAPTKGEIKVAIKACAICHSDITFIDGKWGGQLPALYGHEAAGTVAEIGEGVSGFSVGDHVLVSLIRSCGECFYCQRGEGTFCTKSWDRDAASPLKDKDGASVGYGMHTAAFAEQVVVDASQVVAVPADMGLDVASLLACGVITGAGAVLNTAQVTPGSTVVVIGIGGVGVNALQGAKIAGATKIVAVDMVERKLELATQFGATHTLSARRADLVVAIKELNDGRGADYVFASVGAASVMELAVTMCRPGGTAVFVGIPGSGVTFTLDGITIPNDGLHVLGSKMGATTLKTDIPKMLTYYQEGTLLLDQLVSSRYKLDDINEALDEVRTGAALRSVIVFD
jgi:S-(hydroxymethyl)glutathione dehydrogenase/alcohol dehydrogenase